VKPTGCEAQREANVPFVALVDGRWVEQRVAYEKTHCKPFDYHLTLQWVLG